MPSIVPWNQPLWTQLTDNIDRAHHAYLFFGAQGVGKRELALAYIKQQIDVRNQAVFEAANHPDIHVLCPEYITRTYENDLLSAYAERYTPKHTGKPKKRILIDEIRQLNQSITTHPHLEKKRYVVILAANEMQVSAANALLKNLEEPPKNTQFLLLCHSWQGLPITIRSRCCVEYFPVPDMIQANQWLQKHTAMSEEDIAVYLPLANNQPLLACRWHELNIIETVKLIFTDINQLWGGKKSIPVIAQQWKKYGTEYCFLILQRLLIDLLRCMLIGAPQRLFYPKQYSWLKKVTVKLQKQKVFACYNTLTQSKNMLSSPVDEVLFVEQLLCLISELPESN